MKSRSSTHKISKLPGSGHSFGEVQGQLTTDTDTDLKITEDALAEDTAAFEEHNARLPANPRQKSRNSRPTNKSLSEELEALAKAKALISEKTGDAEYRDNRSVLSSRGGLARTLPKSENSIELAQLRISCCFRDVRRDLLRRRSFREGQGFDQ